MNVVFGRNSHRTSYLRYWSEIANLYTNVPIWDDPVGITQRCLVPGKLERLGYHTLKMYDDVLSRFDTIPERDRRTDRIPLSRVDIAVLTRDKNLKTLHSTQGVENGTENALFIFPRTIHIVQAHIAHMMYPIIWLVYSTEIRLTLYGDSTC